MNREPPTRGKVVIETSIGPFDVDLWSKECPLACRNFIQAALEGIYNNQPIDRIVPGFLAQCGNGETDAFVKPVKIEPHTRLRFRRGSVGMAKTGEQVYSTFFITLAEARELDGEHTLFGVINGDTIYNVLKVNDLAIKNERPLYAPIIKSIRIVDDPFGDVVVRSTYEERMAVVQQVKDKQRMQEKSRLKSKRPLKLNIDEEEDAQVDMAAFKAQRNVRVEAEDEHKGHKERNEHHKPPIEAQVKKQSRVDGEGLGDTTETTGKQHSKASFDQARPDMNLGNPRSMSQIKTKPADLQQQIAMAEDKIDSLKSRPAIALASSGAGSKYATKYAKGTGKRAITSTKSKSSMDDWASHVPQFTSDHSAEIDRAMAEYDVIDPRRR